MDEAILDVVELVHVLYNGLTLKYLSLTKCWIKASADGNSKGNVAVNHKRRGREQGTEVCEGGIGRRCAAACASAAEIPLTRILVLSLRAGPASFLRTCLRSESTSIATDRLALM